MPSSGDVHSDNSESNSDNNSGNSTEPDSEYKPSQVDAQLWDSEREEVLHMYPNLTTSTAERNQTKTRTSTPPKEEEMPLHPLVRPKHI